MHVNSCRPTLRPLYISSKSSLRLILHSIPTEMTESQSRVGLPIYFIFIYVSAQQIIQN